jgi:hypothetical protein
MVERAVMADESECWSAVVSRAAAAEVPIGTVYVAAVDGEEEAVTVATAILKRHWGPARWQGAADGCRVDRGR